MPEEDKAALTTKVIGGAHSAIPVVGLFGAAKCESIHFRYRITKDTFFFEQFLAFFNKDPRHQRPSRGVVCRTLQPESLDYHVHFDWYFDAEVGTFYISFHSGALPKADDEREPYAEQFMSWFGGFLSNETAHADLRSEFDYALNDRRSRFPLPLSVGISTVAVEIDGISVSFSSELDGISAAKIQQTRKRLLVELSGSTRTTFSTFNLQHEVSRLSPIALRLTEDNNI